MNEPYLKIKQFLDENSVEYDELEHEAVYTCEQAAQVCGISSELGVKSLLLKTSEGFVVAVMPGDKKLDSKKMKKLLPKKDFRFAYPEEVKEIMGCEIGACYPFGNLLDLRILADNSLPTKEKMYFNPGIHTKTIIMKWDDYNKLVKPKMADIIT